MKTTALDKLIVAVLDAGGSVVHTFSDRTLRVRVGRKTVIVYQQNGCFDWAFEQVGPNAPRPKTLRTIKAVRALLGI